MNQVPKLHERYSEHGGAGTKLLLAAVILFLIAHAGYNYVPTAYQGESVKQDVETALIQGIAMPASYGKNVDVVKGKIQRALKNNGLAPEEVFVEVKEKNKIITARVYYKKDVPIIPFGIYNYEYVFDYTVTPNGFLVD